MCHVPTIGEDEVWTRNALSVVAGHKTASSFMRRRMAQRVKSYLSWRIFAMALGVLVLVSFAVHGQRNPPTNTRPPATVRGTPPVTAIAQGAIFMPPGTGIVVQ